MWKGVLTKPNGDLIKADPVRPHVSWMFSQAHWFLTWPSHLCFMFPRCSQFWSLTGLCTWGRPDELTHSVHFSELSCPITSYLITQLYFLHSPYQYLKCSCSPRLCLVPACSHENVKLHEVRGLAFLVHHPTASAKTGPGTNGVNSTSHFLCESVNMCHSTWYHVHCHPQDHEAFI